MSCNCKDRRRNRSCKSSRKRAKNTFVAGANACSSFKNVLVCSGFRHHDCNACR